MEHVRQKVVLSFSGLLAALLLPWEGAAADAQYGSQVRPFLAKYCYGCHQGRDAEASLTLDNISGELAAGQSLGKWKAVLERLESGEMPPAEAKQPSKSEQTRIVQWILENLRRGELTHGGGTLRRLNRTEYQNTVRDLFGLHYEAGEHLPQEGAEHGFDTVGSALTVSPLLLEKYLKAAEEITDRAIYTSRPKTRKERFKAQVFVGKRAANPDGSVSMAGHNQSLDLRKKFKAPGHGMYVIRFQAKWVGKKAHPGYRHKMFWEDKHFQNVPDGFVLPRFKLSRSSQGVAYLEVASREVKVYELRAYAEEGEGFNLTFDNGVESVKPQRAKDYTGPKVIVDWVEIEGPVFESWPPESHQRIFFKGPKAKKDRGYAQQILTRVAANAYRRPVWPEEVNKLVSLFDRQKAAGASFEEAIASSIQLILCSPSFLYLFEQGGEPGRALNDYELASRLSYFLWRSLPDDELFAVATSGKLTQDEQVLQQQVRRMLNDPRSSALVESFAAQWLRLDDLDAVAVDRDIYPEYNGYIQYLMRRETEAFFEEILRNDLSILNFIDSDFAMLNDTLAYYYGIQGVQGRHFRRVTLPTGSHRGGLLGQASILTMTTCGTRTSPVMRGAWVLEKIVGREPPRPPMNVPSLDVTVNSAKTIRDRLQLHRQNKACAVCHNKIDPLGFGLEAYSVIGTWRTHERRGFKGRQKSQPIDASGKLESGEGFRGPDQMRKILRSKYSQPFVHAFVKNMLVYSLGRGLTVEDRATASKLAADMNRHGYSVGGLIQDIVKTKAFQSK